MATQIFTPDELSNEEYHALPQRSGSFLHRLLTHCPAKAMFGEIPARKALDFGIWSHAMILEPERFAKAYARDFDPDVYESLLRTATDMSAWLKERGMKVSGSKAELIQRIIDTGEPVHLEEVERDTYRSSIPGYQDGAVELIAPKDFDKIEHMRHAVMADPDYARIIGDGSPELSIVTDEFKCRPDLITNGAWIINYKSTLNAAPEKFGRNADDYGYPMRAVMECELFKQHYGEYPKGYAVLAQEKDSPYLCKLYTIYDRSRDDQPFAWERGRKQLAEAVKIYRKCRDANKWPGLGKAEDLPIPDYILKREGIIQ